MNVIVIERVKDLLTEETLGVLSETAHERVTQDAKWGQQNHLDGTDVGFLSAANAARAVADFNAKDGSLTWANILTEEFYESLAETDPAKLRTELIQVAAVAIAWVEAIDRRQQSQQTTSTEDAA